MKKLELKHLVPYLPYGLKVETLDCNIDYVGKRYDRLIGFHQWDKKEIYWSCLLEAGSRPDLKSVKPILRPLSDLKNKDLDYWIEFGTLIDEMHIDYLVDALINNTFYSKNIHDAFNIYNALFKMHFDVFGLIEQGLAIDINTLEQ